MVEEEGGLYHPWQDYVREFGAKTLKEQKIIESRKGKKQNMTVPFFSSRGSSQPRDHHGSPALQADSLLSEPQGSPMQTYIFRWMDGYVDNMQEYIHTHVFKTIFHLLD